MTWLKKRWTLVLVVATGVFFLLGWMGERYWSFTPELARTCYVLAYIAGAYDISAHALLDLLKGCFDTDLLMLAAAGGAAAIGQWSEGAFLLFLFALAHAGEEYAMDCAREAVDELGQLMPKAARVRRDDQIVEVPIEQVMVGELVVVRPGDRIPVDGTVVKGRSAVDQSAITGESRPVAKEPGLEVFAGTINAENALEVEVTKLAEDNTLQRILRMVSEAQEQKGPTQQFTQRFTRWFVPLVLLATLAMIVIPPLLGNLTPKEAFYRAMLLLVASSPCALALGTPAAILTGIGQAARHGVLIKGGVHLENLSQVKTLAFDKTGTLTEGRFQVTDLEPAHGVSSRELLILAGALEQQSSHPLAEAVVKYAQGQGLAWAAAEGLENVSGLGLRGLVEGREVLVGSPRFVLEEIPEDSGLRERVDVLEGEGKTVVLVIQEGRYRGLLALADHPRGDAKQALQALRELGFSTFTMLTGDNARAAQRVGDLIGVTEVRAELLPEDKTEVVRELRVGSSLVAMVGDGINDAPALALADVGIAMGGEGTAVAVETADVVLMSDDLSKLPFAIELSRASRAIIKQNLVISLGVIGLLSVTSVFGLVPLGPTVIAHEGSTIVVILNALRLFRFCPRHQDLP